MKPSQLTKKIDDLVEKLKPVASEGVRIDFYSFTEPEQLVLLKNFELDDKYRHRWTREAILENKDLIVKGNRIVIERVFELFLSVMPGALMLDEVEAWFFKLNFNCFLERWIQCQRKVSKWSKKDREDFLRDMKRNDQKEKVHSREGVNSGENNGN